MIRGKVDWSNTAVGREYINVNKSYFDVIVARCFVNFEEWCKINKPSVLEEYYPESNCG